MSLIVKRNESSFERIPTDIHNAICISIIELGTQEVNYKGEILNQKKVNITWELPEELMTQGENKDKPFVISKEYTSSINEKARLTKDLIGWRGRSFTAEELKGFKLENILGKACRLTIIDYINPKNNKTYSTVDAIATKSKLFDIETPFNPIVLLDLDNFDLEIFTSLNKYLQDKIEKSPEYKNIVSNDEVEEDYNSEEIPY